MVRVVRTPLCIQQALRDEEPFYVGAISVPEVTSTNEGKTKERKGKHAWKKNRVLPIPPPPKPATLVKLGNAMDVLDW